MFAGRIIAVTALLAALGGLVGALGGALIGLGLVAILERSVPSADAWLLVFRTAGTVGFSVGFVAGPLLSWTLLRKAPIGRAIGETALGAGLAAAIAVGFVGSMWQIVAWSVLGATVAALRLRRATTKTPAPSMKVPE